MVAKSRLALLDQCETAIQDKSELNKYPDSDLSESGFCFGEKSICKAQTNCYNIRVKNFKKALFFGVVAVLAPAITKAFCPVCTIAVAGGIGLSRWLKIDDTITGLWLGAFILSSAFWTNNWFKSKKIEFKGQLALIIILYYTLILLPLYRYDIIGHPLNTFMGADKIIFGSLVGSILFWAAGAWYGLIKTKRGKPHFAFQKIAMPVGLLVIGSGIMYFVTKIH